jgi:hypothetical protein
VEDAKQDGKGRHHICKGSLGTQVTVAALQGQGRWIWCRQRVKRTAGDVPPPPKKPQLGHGRLCQEPWLPPAGVALEAFVFLIE